MIYCKYDELADPKTLKPHPKNRNKHSADQVNRLAEMYKYHGIRHPIIVSKTSGFIVAGHGRKDAAIVADIKKFPVVYQEFESEEKEYSFIQADNAIALWSELDLSEISKDARALGEDFNLDMLGIKNFSMAESIIPIDEDQQKEEQEKKLMLEVTFTDDMEMMDVHDDLVSRGYIVKIK